MLYSEALNNYLNAYLEKERLVNLSDNAIIANGDYANSLAGVIQINEIYGYEQNSEAVNVMQQSLIIAQEAIMNAAKPVIIDMFSAFVNIDGVQVGDYIIELSDGGDDIVVVSDTTT